MTIQWFPGHMAKARRLLEDNIELVDVVIELRDARLPISSANPLLAEIVGEKPRVICLTKPDLADDKATRRFLSYFEGQGLPGVAVNARDNKGTKELMNKAKLAAGDSIPRDKANNVPLRAVRVMVAGIPNVGKSSLINAISGRAAARTGATPGLTRAKQWITLKSGIEVLDTPGLLWPRIDDPAVAFRLAITGAIGEGGFDTHDLAAHLAAFLGREYPETLLERYRVVVPIEATGEEIVRLVGARRGCLVSGGQVDLTRASDLLLQEFRSGKIGRFTLDREV